MLGYTDIIRRGKTPWTTPGEGSGGWVKPSGAGPVQGSPGQLYDISRDPYETNDLWDEHPEIVERLADLLGKYKKEGRSS